jgi:UDP-N-acetylglucosamine 2-epimerase (non-hydrolysing)
VKLAPVVHALTERGHDVVKIATGQHYDASLTDTFFEELGMHPHDRWVLPDTESARVGAILALAYDCVEAIKPDLVLVQGDTYTVPLFCMAARRHRVPIAHLEAGLRSFNDTSMEEVDRKIAAAIAQVHFAPTAMAASFLAREGVDPARVHVVGNSVLDVLRARGATARPFGQRAGVVVTAHRATNVDNPARLAALVQILLRLQDEVGPVTFPVHPRTYRRLDAVGAARQLGDAGIDLRGPVPFDTMLDLLAGARVVVTDSGGLQEEASWLRVPVVVMRRSTPRWEGIEAGSAVLTGLDVERTVAAVRHLATDTEQERVAAVPCPFGDGFTSQRVADILDEPATMAQLALEEPDFLDQPVPC